MNYTGRPTESTSPDTWKFPETEPATKELGQAGPRLPIQIQQMYNLISMWVPRQLTQQLELLAFP